MQGHGRRGDVANGCERCASEGSKPLPHASLGARASRPRIDGTCLAHGPCRLTRGTGWELGPRGSDDAGAVQANPARKLTVRLGTVTVVPTRATRDARGRDRPRQGSSSHVARGVGIGARDRDRKVTGSDMRHRNEERHHGVRLPRHDASGRRSRPKRACFTARHLATGPPARTAWDRVEPLYEIHGIASPRAA